MPELRANDQGIIVYFVTDYQAAVELGGQAYRDRYGQPPTHVALPRCVDPASLELWSLALSRWPASPGTVQLWRSDNGGNNGTTE